MTESQLGEMGKTFERHCDLWGRWAVVSARVYWRGTTNPRDAVTVFDAENTQLPQVLDLRMGAMWNDSNSASRFFLANNLFENVARH